MAVWKSELFCTAFNKGQLPPSTRPEIVMVGRSNVGKSTLINALLSRRIARISATPGKTRSINFYNVSGAGHDFCLVDLPGYGYAARGVNERKEWWNLINSYFEDEERQISFVMHLVDFRHGPLVNDEELTKWLDSMEMPRLVVFTKGDKISPGRRKAVYAQHLCKMDNSLLPPFVTCGTDDREMASLRSGIIAAIDEIKRLDEAAGKK